MSFSSTLGQDLAQVLKYGTQVRFRYFTPTFSGTSYDDDIALAKSGTDLYISGLLSPLDRSDGSSEAILVQQGLLDSDTIKLFINGSIMTGSQWFRVGIGSPASGGSEYALVPNGVQAWEVEGTTVLKQVYLKRLPTGSLLGE